MIDPDHVPDAGSGGAERTDGAVVRVEEEPFLPLPVNETQLRILQQVDRHAQTLIQGPPGTGKTHTAAVLISHLLAQGKRVLVTAHTDRALKEVRGKLPEAVRPLAVSVVGATREDKSELRVAVERIGAWLPTTTPPKRSDTSRSTWPPSTSYGNVGPGCVTDWSRPASAKFASTRWPATAARPPRSPGSWSSNERARLDRLLRPPSGPPPLTDRRDRPLACAAARRRAARATKQRPRSAWSS